MPDLHIAGITFTPVDDEADGDTSTAERADRADRANNADRADRAQQFMPFAALRGYYDMVRERERIVEPRRDLTEDEAARMSRRLQQVRKGMMVTVTHYDTDAYVRTTGVVTAIDTTFRTLTIVRTSIPFDDITDIVGDGIEVDDSWS